MECNIAVMLQDYVKPIMQLLTNDVRDYNMKLLTTKCLNTAVMISFFLLGKEKGLLVADTCDSHKTTETHMAHDKKSYKSLNEKLAQNLFRDLLKPTKSRQMFYMMMTNNKFPYDDPEKKPAHFCGHVFVIEKVPGEHKPSFYFYQSYINEYTLKGYVKDKRNNKISLTFEEMSEMIRKLQYVVLNEYWDPTSVRYWRDITHVDTSEMKGSRSKGKINICYKIAKVKTCVGHLKKYVEEKLQELEAIEDKQAIYGDPSYYDEKMEPLTVQQLLSELKNLYNKLK